METISSSNRAQLTLRAPAELRNRLADAAALRGLSVNSFVLQAATREADEILKQQRDLHLSSADAEMILNLLEKPPEPNAALARAFARRQELFHA